MLTFACHKISIGGSQLDLMVPQSLHLRRNSFRSNHMLQVRLFHVFSAYKLSSLGSSAPLLRCSYIGDLFSVFFFPPSWHLCIL